MLTTDNGRATTPPDLELVFVNFPPLRPLSVSKKLGWQKHGRALIKNTVFVLEFKVLPPFANPGKKNPVHPVHGPATGGTDVTFGGAWSETFRLQKRVTGGVTVYCRFGMEYFEGNYTEEDNSLHCVTTEAYVGTSVTMYLSLNEQQYVATSNGANDATLEWKWKGIPHLNLDPGDNSKYSYFSFYDQTRVTSINPDRSPLNTLLMIQIDFRYSCGFRDRKDTLCKFGDKTVPAGIVSAEDQDAVCLESGHPCLTCISPMFDSPQVMPLAIALNGRGLGGGDAIHNTFVGRITVKPYFIVCNMSSSRLTRQCLTL